LGNVGKELYKGELVFARRSIQRKELIDRGECYSQGNHCTTLFSLISLGSTPNLESFWKEVSFSALSDTSLVDSHRFSPPRQSSGRFPAHLIYNSIASTVPPGFSFPLVAPSHACFLIGFYNANRPSQALPPSNGATTASPQSQPISASTPNSSTTTNSKRPAPASPVINNNQSSKKSKPNPAPQSSSTTPALPANSPPNPTGAFLTGNRIQQQPTPPNSTRPTNSTAPPSINQSPSTTTKRFTFGAPSFTFLLHERIVTALH